MKKFLFLILAALFCAGAHAQDFKVFNDKADEKGFIMLLVTGGLFVKANGFYSGPQDNPLEGALIYTTDKKMQNDVEIVKDFGGAASFLGSKFWSISQRGQEYEQFLEAQNAKACPYSPQFDANVMFYFYDPAFSDVSTWNYGANFSADGKKIESASAFGMQAVKIYQKNKNFFDEKCNFNDEKAAKSQPLFFFIFNEYSIIKVG